MFEVGGKKEACEFRWVPHHEALRAPAPRYDVVRRRVINHLIRLQEERRRSTSASGRGGGHRCSSVHSVLYDRLRTRFGTLVRGSGLTLLTDFMSGVGLVVLVVKIAPVPHF